MQLDDIRLLRMERQHLFTSAQDELQVLRENCGLQAQFYGNCLHALRLRCGKAPDENILRTSAAKTWTLRGTLHLIALDDLPLFLYDGRSHFLRPCDTMEDDDRLSAVRKRELSAIILDAVQSGCGDREELRLICREHGMTADEEQSAFDAWGGLLRALCEGGELCHTAQQKKAFRPCPPFVPMTKAAALRELMRRYLTHYGPVTVQDASYFFGLPQRELLPVIESLSPQESICEGKIFYSLGDINITGDLSCCRFLAGFDPLMLGYEKRSNPFLPEEALRGVFTLAGIVRPSILLDGKIVGVWKRRGKAVELTGLMPLQASQRKRVEAEALRLFGDEVSKLVWNDQAAPVGYKEKLQPCGLHG